MIKNMLANEGLESQIEGEYLQGGVGELQAIGIVRLMVDDADYLQAMEIIQKWESIEETPCQDRPKGSSGAINGFVLGVALTAGIAYLLFITPVTTDGIDYNGDGVLDEKWVYSGGRISVTSLDRDLDGAYDFIYYYDHKGLLKSAKSDDNFDGVFETKIDYRNGQAVREDSDKDQNGIIDYRIDYQYGMLRTIEFIDESTNKVRKRQRYEWGRLSSADYDSNLDGKLDRHYEYDRFEESK